MKQQKFSHKELLMHQKFRDKSDERIEQKHMREELAECERYKKAMKGD